MTIPAKNARRRLRLLAVLTLVALLPAGMRAVVPVAYPPPIIVPVDINVGPGDQYDPHVSGDWVAYSSDDSIRYYNFATGIDAAVPPPPAGAASVRDLLSDISGSKIVFSRISTASTAVMVFDAAMPGTSPVELDAAPGTVRIGTAIGGDTAAYIDFGLQARGELVIHDLGTGTSVRMTNDTAYDQNPSVSPSGNVVVWEHCATSGSNCDIWQAAKTGGSWIVSEAANSGSSEANPDTNGTLVVYDSLRTSESDIFWRAASGGAEGQLELPGFQQNPSIAGNYIAFEGRPSLFATGDLFLYDIVNNRLFQITDTPTVTEQLNDITVLPDGRLRVVWTSDEDGFDQRSIKGATFQVSNAPPVLSYSAEPGYGTDGVNPDTGLASTSFVYKVVYRDFDNQAPSYIDVCIDGLCHAMGLDASIDIDALLTDGDYRNGEQYTYTSSLALGVHDYFFRASDGTDAARLPATTLAGPSVNAPSIPVLSVPATITANATGPSGVPVTYLVSATDAVDPNPSIVCSPVSGSTFPAGTTVVSCTATTASGAQSTATFNVVVNGAASQVTDLIEMVMSFNLDRGVAKSLDARLQQILAALVSGGGADERRACRKLDDFISEVTRAGKAISRKQSGQLVAAAVQVKAVLGCP